MQDPGGMFYVCGPPPMMVQVLEQLALLGVGKGSIISEGM
jgi:NAD(P)H-flavin reductase